MKRTLLSILSIALAFGANAQVFTPSASTLPAGTMGQAYAGQVINFTVPSTTSISGSVVEDAVIAAYPAAATVIGFLGLGSQTFDMTVSSTTITVDGLPSGVSAVCDASPCTYIAGASGFITLSGTPTQAGVFTMDITTLTSGEADLSAFAGQLAAFGIPSSFAIPQPVPGALDETGYTMAVSDPNGIDEHNEVFSLSLYPNPTEGVSILNVNSTVAGLAVVDVYSITGAMVQTSTESIRTGANRINLDLQSLPAGIYMVRTDINGTQALVRVLKK